MLPIKYLFQTNLLTVLFSQVNNHKPTFDSVNYSFTVMESNYTNDKIKLGVLRARDEDIGKNGLVEYTISSNVAADFPYTIDVHTGELFAQGFIDREQREIYTFEVTVIESLCNCTMHLIKSNCILGTGFGRTTKQFHYRSEDYSGK